MAAAAAATVATMGIAACGVMREPEYLWKLRIGGASNQQHALARRRAGEPDTQHRHKRKQTSGEGVRFSFPVHAGSGAASESCKCKGK